MSYTFYTTLSSQLSYEMILDWLPHRNLRCEESENDEISLHGQWHPDLWHHFYLHGTSTRSVEVGVEDERFSVRIMSGSCPEDYELAIDMILHVARAMDGVIEPEDGESFAHWERESRFGREWVEQHCRSTNQMIIKAAMGGTPLSLPGPIRPTWVGPRLVRRISTGNRAALDQRFFDAIRQVQYPGDVHPALPVRVAHPAHPERVFSCSIVGPRVSYLLSDIEYVIPAASKEMYIEKRSLEQLIPEKLTWLDDHNLLIEAIDSEQWSNLVERAREFAVDPLEVLANGTEPFRKKWWQFWR